MAEQTKADYERTARLSMDKIMSQQQLDLAKANYDSANAGVGAAAANVTQAEAQVSQKAAALAVAQTNLNYTVIRSPIDGTVVARNVDVGQTVAASLQAPTILPSRKILPRCWSTPRRTSLTWATSDQGRQLRSRWMPSEGYFSRGGQPGAHESDDGAKRGYLRHNHRIRES